MIIMIMIIIIIIIIKIPFFFENFKIFQNPKFSIFPQTLLFKRSAHSAVPNWMLGCLDALRIGGRIGRIGRMGRIEDQEDW